MEIDKQVYIRPEQPEDMEDVYEVNRLAFGQDDEADLVDRLRQSQHFVPELSLVALDGEQTVGYILFTHVLITDDNGNQYGSLALAPVSVLPEYQNQGIGKQLIRYGLECAAQLGYMSVIVLGHELYYPKFGFIPASTWNIRSPYDVPDNVFMAIELIPGGLDNISGMVVYPKEFDKVSI